MIMLLKPKFGHLHIQYMYFDDETNMATTVSPKHYLFRSSQLWSSVNRHNAHRCERISFVGYYDVYRTKGSWWESSYNYNCSTKNACIPRKIEAKAIQISSNYTSRYVDLSSSMVTSKKYLHILLDTGR